MAHISGDFIGKAVKQEFGGDGKGRPKVFVSMEVTEGDRKGMRFPYEGKLSPEGIKWTKRDMIALGWKPGRDGKYDANTFVDDVTKANVTVPFTVEVARWVKDDGTVKEWSTVRSIGQSAAPLVPLEKDKVADVNSWFAEAGDIGGQATPDRKPSSDFGGDDSLPF
jgi:hypothetical protein